MQYPLAQELNVPGYQKVIRFEVPSLQLKGFIAIHNTFRGPALGGTRLWHYDNESLALKDVLRLAEGMTYKAAATQLPLGGGKAVLIGQPSIKSKAYFQAYGYYVNSLNGQYITAEDVNTNTEDMASILLSTPHVVGLRNKSGNPSPWTALGAFKGIQASIQYLWHEKKIEQCRFAIQGVGATGLEVIHHLVKAGVTSITIADINPLHLEQATKLYPMVRVVDSKMLLFEPVDVLVPCALGGILNQNTIPKIKAKIIAGTANNLLENYEVDKQLINQQGILLAPDFIINAGGLIHVSKEVTKENDKQTIERLNQIGPRLLAIYELAKHKKISTFQAATLYASQHFQ
jgi:leucine dehydrogenase